MTSAFLEEAPGGGFRLGLQVLALARLTRKGYGFSGAILPLMKKLTQRFHQTVLLTRRVGDIIVCVEREESTGQYIRLSYERGTTLDINAGASALVLLAWLPEDEARSLLTSRELRKFSPNTLTDVDLLIERLAQIRTQGYAISYGEVDADALGIAAPIFDESGTVVAALSIVAIERRLPESARPELIEALESAATEASRTLAVIMS
ncbi:IclR family transcriptional regulator [Glaciibacter superstes]|uniref:IclR family transcriptional regulator n=1 Tax=Glaciibacter superstes TaxID=501023 RepID=UPI001FE1F744|nr:IclR family transcriptional regulator [Glaciibacter superstes]